MGKRSLRALRAELREFSVQFEAMFTNIKHRHTMNIYQLEQLEKKVTDPEMLALIRRLSAKLNENFLRIDSIRVMIAEAKELANDEPVTEYNLGSYKGDA